MHTLTTWKQETPFQRTERFTDWYETYVEFNGEPTTVTVHEVWENYGGPEEGGWYYECRYPIETICIFSKPQAIRILHELHEKYDAPEYEEGTYDICLAQSVATWSPKVRPHYE